MDKNRKKELSAAYKERRPEMGVLSLRCGATGEEFLMPAADLPAKRNRILFQLNAGSCPNKRLQALWTEHGEAGFTLEAAKTLDYDDPAEDHTEELETLCELCLLERPGAQRLWR